MQQSLSDFEVICVNDGSTDNSQAIIDNYASQYPNVRCINQPNGGLSDARNTGIDNAQGQYIFFLDGDDTLADTHTLSTALKVCTENDLELFIGNALVDGQQPYLTNFPNDDRLLTGPEITHLFLTNNRTIIEPVWCYIYSKAFLNTHQLQFKKGIYHEDILFTPQVLYLAERCMCKNISFVNYQTHRAGAITTTTTLKHLTDKRDTARELYYFFQSKSTLEPMTRRIIFDIYRDVIFSANTNSLLIKDIIMPEDRSIMSRCAVTKQDWKTIRLLHLSPFLSARYSSNTLHPILRKTINHLPF